MKEEFSKSESKKDYFKSKKTFNTIKLKSKYQLKEVDYIRWNSCNNLNFVPKISPKKSFCIPSLLVLNPENAQRQNSDDVIDKKKLCFDSDSDDNSLELSFESSKDEEIKNKDENLIINKETNNPKNDFNLENNLKSNFDENNYNKYDSGEYVTILDILSMNHK